MIVVLQVGHSMVEPAAEASTASSCLQVGQEKEMSIGLSTRYPRLPCSMPARVLPFRGFVGKKIPTLPYGC